MAESDDLLTRGPWAVTLADRGARVMCRQPTVTSQAPVGACGALSDLMAAEQKAIQDLQAGSISGPTAESTLTGVNGQLAQASEQAGRMSILGIGLTQLVSENGTLSEALDQSVPIANLGTVISSVDQDISNVESNCHAP